MTAGLGRALELQTEDVSRRTGTRSLHTKGSRSYAPTRESYGGVNKTERDPSRSLRQQQLPAGLLNESLVAGEDDGNNCANVRCSGECVPVGARD